MKQRADIACVEAGLAQSREKAQAMIMAGQIYIGEKKIEKSSEPVDDIGQLHIHGQTDAFASRGGHKLEKAITTFRADVNGCVCMDIGAATGGFTDVLLRHGAQHVYSIDVGYGQLDWKLRNDSRVVNLERTNLRYVTEEQIPEKLDIAVCDVSFISLKLVMPAVAPLLKPDAEIMCLIKPQFEAGRELVGKKGVVRDKKVHEAVIRDILSFMPTIGFSVTGIDYSPITGPEGNIEFLLYMHNSSAPSLEPDITSLVESAHRELKS